MEQLPVFLRLKGRPCLVAGGGAVAERKVRLLVRAGAQVTVVAPSVNERIAALAAEFEMRVRLRDYRTADIAGIRLVIAATGNNAVNRSIAEDCERRGTWCNVVDDCEHSGFIFPAIVDRSPVIVAIGTGGNAPVLARQLKRKIEAMLPSRIGQLAQQAGRWRSLVRRRFCQSADRLRFWQRFFDGPAAEYWLAGEEQAAERLVRRDLIGRPGDPAKPKGIGWIVGAGPGDPDLVTLKAHRYISCADVVLYDRLVAPPILEFARKDAELIDVGKSPELPGNRQEDINALLVSRVAAGNRVCRLKGGDPFIFGRGGEEIRALQEAGLPYEVVPGISAAIGCAAAAGIPLTYRGVSSSVTLATARLDGGPAPDWRGLLKGGHTLALYMSVGAIDSVRTALLDHGVAADLPVAIVEAGTTPRQRVFVTTVSGMADEAGRQGIRAPALTYVGDVVKLMAPNVARDGAANSRPHSDQESTRCDGKRALAASFATGRAGGRTTGTG